MQKLNSTLHVFFVFPFYSLEFFFFLFQVSSREEIVHQGYENVKVKSSDGVVEGEVMFKVPVRARMAPKMVFLAYCVLPSETVLAASRTFQTEKCFENKVLVHYNMEIACM